MIRVEDIKHRAHVPSQAMKATPYKDRKRNRKNAVIEVIKEAKPHKESQSLGMLRANRSA